jgi:hypothetical protein
MINGIWGHPFIDLTRYIDTSRLTEIDEEICYALTQVPTEYTGGSHRTLGIVPPSLPDAGYADYGEVIRGFSRAEFARFISLSEDPGKGEFDLTRYQEYQFGEEQSFPLSRRQMLYLKYRYGVYFPWQIFYEMIPTLNWADKSSGVGKSFTPEARHHFPKTIAFVRSLPFAEIGRCNVLGLDPDHHGTVHQDGDLEELSAEHFITICPRGNKRLFLWDEEQKQQHFVNAAVYWFNDHGYHGVAPDPYFRYSIRVDGVFQDAFFARLRRDYCHDPKTA